ncbi:MAG: hypothetical protein JST45_06250 [Bacteroidetes bacterium]|nr:hypothetical protein [Bacteroidota bacterium]
MLHLVRAFLLSLAMAPSFFAWAGSPVKWSFAAIALKADTVQVQLNATCEPGWHIYALTLPSDDGPLPTVVKVDQGTGYAIAGAPCGPVPVEKLDPAFGILVHYHEGTATFTQDLLRSGSGPFKVHGYVEYMACNDKTCLPPTREEFNLDIPPAALK